MAREKELRRALLEYKLHTDQELFDKAYEYIRQYYQGLTGQPRGWTLRDKAP